MPKSAAERAAERMSKLEVDGSSGSAIREGLAQPVTTSPEPVKEAKPVRVPTRRQTVDFEIPEHNRLKRLAMEHNTNVSHLIRMVMSTVDDERIDQILGD